MSKETLFTKIAEGKVKSYIFMEDDKYMAFLTPFANTKGVTVVAPKKNMSSYIFDIKDDSYLDFLKFVRKVAKHLDKKLGTVRCALVFEGTGINHLHAKLYPLHGQKAKQTDVGADHTIYFDEYPGYITTAEGPESGEKDLKKLQEFLKE